MTTMHSSTAWHVERLKAVLDAATENNHRGEVHVVAWVNNVFDGMRLGCDDCGDETDTDRTLVYYVCEGGGDPFQAPGWWCPVCLPDEIRRGEVVLENPEVVAEQIARIVALDAEDADGRKHEGGCERHVPVCPTCGWPQAGDGKCMCAWRTSEEATAVVNPDSQ